VHELLQGGETEKQKKKKHDTLLRTAKKNEQGEGGEKEKEASRMGTNHPWSGVDRIAEFPQGGKGKKRKRRGNFKKTIKGEKKWPCQGK